MACEGTPKKKPVAVSVIDGEDDSWTLDDDGEPAERDEDLDVAEYEGTGDNSD